MKSTLNFFEVLLLMCGKCAISVYLTFSGSLRHWKQCSLDDILSFLEFMNHYLINSDRIHPWIWITTCQLNAHFNPYMKVQVNVGYVTD